MSDIYCGAKNPPKGKRRGSMKECVEKRQVSYFGIKKVDSRLLNTIQNPKKNTGAKVSFEKIAEERGRLQAKIKKIEKQIINEKSSKKKKEIEAERDKLKKKLIDVIKKFNELNKSQKKLSRTVSKKSKKSK